MIETGVRLREQAGCLPRYYDDPVEAAMLRRTGASAAAGGTDGRGDIVNLTILDHMLQAAQTTGEPAISSSDVLTHLASVEPTRYARGEKESASAWLSRAAKALHNELINLGVDIAPERITLTDGSRPSGYTLRALQRAAAALDAAA
jgi:S-DNA-T family DNA segregation ATPase FtsK/SpoIIIE